jgi:hypothetical protein
MGLTIAPAFTKSQNRIPPIGGVCPYGGLPIPNKIMRITCKKHLPAADSFRLIPVFI